MGTTAAYRELPRFYRGSVLSWSWNRVVQALVGWVCLAISLPYVSNLKGNSSAWTGYIGLLGVGAACYLILAALGCKGQAIPNTLNARLHTGCRTKVIMMDRKRVGYDYSYASYYAHEERNGPWNSV